MDTGCARASARCARERLAEQNRARDREYKRALRDRLRVNGDAGDAGDARGGVCVCVCVCVCACILNLFLINLLRR